MKKKFLAYIMTACMLVGLVPTTAMAEEPQTLYVNNELESYENADGITEEAAFETVAEAIEVANAGDTIKIVATETAYDAFKIPEGKDGITIEGVVVDGDKPIINTCYKDSPTWEKMGCGGIDLYAQNVTLKNLKIINDGYTKYWHASSIGYYYENTKPKDNLTVDSCDFVGSDSGTAIIYHNANFTLKDSTFKDFDTAFLSCNDHRSLGNVTITGNSYDSVDDIVNIYYGKELPTEGDPCITITNNTIKSAKDEPSKILITDHAQKRDSSSKAAIKAVITGNTKGTEVALECVNMTATNDIVLDEAAAENTTVYHQIDVNMNGYESVTITDADGQTQTLTKDSKVSLPVADTMTFGDVTVPAAKPVEITYTTAGGVSTTVEAAVKPADPTENASATLNGVDEDGNVTNTPVEPPKADEVYAAKVIDAEGNETSYTSLADAFDAAAGMENPVIDILGDVTMDTWEQVWDADGWTINGNNKTITIGEVASNGNGDYLFYRAENLNVSDLNVKFTTSGNGFDMKSGTLKNVNMTGAGNPMSHAVFVGSSSDASATVTIQDCEFTNFDWAVYSQPAGEGVSNPALTVEDSKISNSSIGVLSFSETTVLKDNVISDVKEISLAGALDENNTNVTYTITGNTLENVTTVDLHEAPLNNVTFTENKVDTNSKINATEGSTGTLNVNDNYWGGGEPSNTQVVVPDSEDVSVKKDEYYKAPSMEEEDKNTYVPETPSRPSGSSSKPKYDITVEDSDNGEVKSSTSRSRANREITITVTPDKGYELDELTIETEKGKEIDFEKGSKAGTFVFDMPRADVVVEASFEKADDAEETPEEDEDVSDETDKALILTIGSKIINVDGEYIVYDVAPVIKGERTMLPIRVVAEYLGADVEWNETEQKVTITKDDVVIEIFINQPFATVNGTPVQLDAPAFIENGRTYLPVRFVADHLGAKVIWDDIAKTVTIIPAK